MIARTQERILRLALEIFGPCALDRKERAARLVEEAIKVAQVELVPMPVIERILARVYSRPAGEIAQELGQTMLMLQSMAECVGLELDECADTEWKRWRLVPAEHFREKHAAKARDGVAEIGTP